MWLSPFPLVKEEQMPDFNPGALGVALSDMTRPPFSVLGVLRTSDEKLEELILRTSNILERLYGPSLENTKAALAASGSAEYLATSIGDKLSALMNNIARIDNSI